MVTRAPSQSGTRQSTSASEKSRHLAHLHSQLAQLAAHLSDLENQIKVTSVQAQAMRDLGGYCGGMFMAASKVLGEEMMSDRSGQVSQEANTTSDSRKE